jgi:agmatinase
MDRAALRAPKIAAFNPDGVGLRNGRFIGLPFDEEESEVVIISVPWDVTVSYAAGTADGPRAVIEESGQLDLEDSLLSGAWQKGIYLRPPVQGLRESSAVWRRRAEDYIRHLEIGGDIGIFEESCRDINHACESLHEHIFQNAQKLFREGKTPGVLGGDHSSPYGLIRASLERYPKLGILQIDAHMDLRAAYEGFTWSHASIFYNVLESLPLQRLVQVGIRDYCAAEWQYAQQHADRVKVFRDRDIAHAGFEGTPYSAMVERILAELPEEVHISFDIDGLEPSLCTGTGTPVPGGLSFNQAMYLLEQVLASGRRIVSFDLCEVGGREPWDANVGARILYKMACLAG